MIRDGVRRAFRLALRRRDAWEEEVEAEIKLHLALRAEQLMDRGLARDDAYAEAVRRFGPLSESRARLLDAARHREEHMQRTEYLSDLRQDLTFAVRTLRREKGWTAVTVLTLALGIAATTAVFSVVSSVLLHAVGYPDADRVVLVFEQPMSGNNTGINVTIVPNNPVVRAWKSARSLEDVEAYGFSHMQLETSGRPADMTVATVEPTFVRFAGGHPLLGRMFTQSDIDAGARVVVLGEGLWRTRFAGDSGVIGKRITLEDSLYTVIGVLPARVQPPRVTADPVDAWLPIDLRGDRGGALVVARLRRGAREPAAAAELDSIATRVTGGKANFHALITTPAKRVSFHDSLVMLAASVALVLLVACANVAHLLLARSTSRQRELAIRVALGAGRGRVFRQLLTESVVLAGAGGLLGVVGGWLALRALLALRPPALSALAVAHVDGTTLAVALVVTAGTSLLFGVMGALRSTRISNHEVLKTGGTHGSTGRGRARQVLVITEMALSATLAVGAAMLVRSVMNMQRANLGFDPRGLYALTLTAPKRHFASSGDRAATTRSLMTRLTAMPGVQSVALAASPPGWFSFTIGRLEVDGQADPSTPATSFNAVNQVGSGYFAAMGIRLVEGAGFTDTTAGGGQVIVNERFARKQWRGAPAVGHRLRVSRKGDEPWLTVVGVAAETQAGGPMMAESTAPLLYTPAADSEANAVMVRAAASSDLLPRVQAIARQVDPALTPELHSIETMVSDSIAVPRFVMLLLTTFTMLALALAAIGLYGVMAYSVAQRTREIGIRVALGATAPRIARGVVAGGLALAVIGGVLGATLSAWGTKLIETNLYGVAKHDVWSVVAATIVLIAVAVVACVVPARRALAVDPMTAIRAD